MPSMGINAPQRLRVVSVSASRALTADDFKGDVILDVSNASAVTLTINTGLNPLGAVLVKQSGAGQVTIAAGGGVTLHSADSLLSTRVQHSMISVQPMGSEVFAVVGDLA